MWVDAFETIHFPITENDIRAWFGNEVMPLKDDCFPSIIEQAFQISPEAIKAQREQDLKDLAEYRARHLQAYKDWADPVKREAKKAKAEADMKEAWKLMANKSVDDFKMIQPGQKKFYERINVTKLPGTPVTTTIWSADGPKILLDKIWGWFVK